MHKDRTKNRPAIGFHTSMLYVMLLAIPFSTASGEELPERQSPVSFGSKTQGAIVFSVSHGQGVRDSMVEWDIHLNGSRNDTFRRTYTTVPSDAGNYPRLGNGAHVIVAAVPAGDYQIDSWAYDDGEHDIRVSLHKLLGKYGQEIPFTVEPGQVSYLGNIDLAVDVQEEKNQYDHGVFSLKRSDLWAETAPLVRRLHPALTEADVVAQTREPSR